jgi:hypothetical protein
VSPRKSCESSTRRSSCARRSPSLKHRRNPDPSLRLPRLTDEALRGNLDEISRRFQALEPLLRRTIGGSPLAKAELPTLTSGVDELIRLKELAVMILDAALLQLEA